MKSNLQKGRITGFLFLIIFITGVAVYQFLRGPYVFSDDFVNQSVAHSLEIKISIILSFISASISIFISIYLLPLFQKKNKTLAYLYIAFCVINFGGIAFENYHVLSLLDYSSHHAQSIMNSGSSTIGIEVFDSHELAHLSYLLLSCIPVFLLYTNLFVSKLIPKWISIFGMMAVVLMAIEMIFQLMNIHNPYNLMIPIGLIQLFLPFWLLLKGFRSE